MSIDISQTQRDVYQWRVIYQDGAITDEYDPTRKDGRGFAECEQKPVAELRLIRCQPFDGHAHRVLIPQGAAPIFFRRRAIAINLTYESTTQQPTTHCIGWKRGEQAVYLFVFDDGSTLLTDNLQAV